MNQLEINLLKSELKSGNNEFLKSVFEEHGAYCLFNIMRKFGCPREDAEDLLIDAIINFRDKLLSGKIQYLTSVRNYLYTTCVNMKKEKDYYRKRQKEKAHEVEQYLYSDDHESNAHKEMLLKLAMESFRQLSEPCQQILRYFYIYKYSMEELAKRVGLANANSAKVTKARCYKKWLEIIKKSKNEPLR